MINEKLKAIPAARFRKQLRDVLAQKKPLKNILNLEKLYLGIDVNQLMDEPGIYHNSNFIVINRFLKYRTVTDMLNDVLQSGWFYVAQDSSKNYGVAWFASPVFFEETDIEKVGQSSFPSTLFDGMEEDPQCKKNSEICSLNMTTSSINTLVVNNMIPPGRTATPLRGAAREEGKSGNEASGNEVSGNGLSGQGSVTPLGLSRAQRGEIVDAFIRAMRTVEEAPTFDSLREKLIAQGETEENAKGIIGYLMTHTVRNHFMEQDRFFRASFEARKAWLVNVLYGNGADRRLTGAKKYYRAEMMRRTQTDAQERLKLIRGNRPISPHEWMNNGKRYYQDPHEGVVAIPNDAPPRPGENAIWSVYMLKWMER